MRPSTALATHREHELAIALAHGAHNVRVFGSVASGLDRDGSDLDLLVDLPRGTSLLGIVSLQFDIEDALGIKVDLCTESELHPALRERILADARKLKTNAPGSSWVTSWRPSPTSRASSSKVETASCSTGGRGAP